MKKVRECETSTALNSLRPGKYARGLETVDLILNAARRVLVDEGATAFTLRRIATECNLKVGNISRHFPRKEMLIQALLYELLLSNEELIESNIRQSGMSAEEALTLVITGTLTDIGRKEMTHLFTELWAMSNHDDFVAGRVEETYRYVNALIGSLVKQMNTSLSADEVETVSLFISATMEGTTVLAGYGRPWEKKMPQISRISVKWLIEMVKTIRSEDIGSL